MSGLSIQNVKKSFGQTHILKGIDLEIPDGEFVILVGPSGCGKSTLLNCIAGLEEVTEGRILMGDTDMTFAAPKDRDIAMVFQSYALYPNMNVRKNIAFGLEIRKMPKQEIEEIVDRVAKLLQIENLLDRKPSQLSGGQRQRVALGRAIVRKPSVFLFDEPLSNLDAELRVQMRAEIANLQKRLGITSVYVTHDQVEAMTMGDRIAVLHDGNLRQVGSPLDLYDTPANVFVAQFIGTPNMNILKMNVSEDGKQLVHADVTINTPDNWKEGVEARKGKEVFVGFRPEHVRGSEEHEWKNTAVINGKVSIVETLGHEVVVHMSLDHEKKEFIAKMDVHKTPQLGSTVELHINTDKLHLFDGETEERL